MASPPEPSKAPDRATEGAGTQTTDTSCAPLVDALRLRLTRLAARITALSPEQYTAAGARASSIGAHWRHTLDVPEAIVSGAARGLIDYEARARGTPCEHHVEASLRRLERIDAGLRQLADLRTATPITIVTQITPERAPARLRSCLGRELANALSHTVHHAALIKLRAGDLGPPDDELDMAPGTVAFRREQGGAA
ncbi:MAG: hypothetical protein H6713_06150 [Myxococcales bacterium]|nr:hypothetical protein [Myxococcales bacterium]MCB9749574.1 hypothetical protein [Myxococcales bacterium]